MRTLEESKNMALSAIAADLLAGKRVSSVRYNARTGQMEQTYGTTDFRKRLSELRLDYGMNICYDWEKNIGNKGQHKVHYMTQDDIESWKNRQTLKTA